MLPRPNIGSGTKKLAVSCGGRSFRKVQLNDILFIDRFPIANECNKNLSITSLLWHHEQC